MMTALKFVFSLTCLFMGNMAQKTDVKSSLSVRQTRHFVSVKVGDNVTLQCFYEGDDSAWLFWYKQTLGQKPNVIATNYVYDTRITFYEEFKDNPRFILDIGNGKNHLTIKDVRISDSATYYCTVFSTHVFTFAEGTTVSVEGSGVSVQALVHQSASETIQPGGSVTLNCTVHTGTCEREHWVYWFRDSEQSHPGLIYTHGGSSDQCERKPETQTHSCVYNLPMKSLNPSHAGTYYCAVASCGHILFGNGTKLDFEDEAHSPALVYFLSGAFASTTILTLFLAFLLYKERQEKRNSHSEAPGRFSAPSTADVEGYRDADNLHYAALSVHLPNRPTRQRNYTNNECVYSGVKQ